jgi:hypothetical protein
MPQYKVKLDIIFEDTLCLTEITEVSSLSLSLSLYLDLLEVSHRFLFCLHPQKGWGRELRENVVWVRGQACFSTDPILILLLDWVFLSAPSNLQLSERRKNNRLPADRRAGQSISSLQSNSLIIILLLLCSSFSYVIQRFQQRHQSYHPLYSTCGARFLSCCMSHTTPT